MNQRKLLVHLEFGKYLFRFEFDNLHKKLVSTIFKQAYLHTSVLFPLDISEVLILGIDFTCNGFFDLGKGGGVSFRQLLKILQNLHLFWNHDGLVLGESVLQHCFVQLWEV